MIERIVCAECGRPDDGRRGWKAYLGGGVFGDPEETFVFCPECAEREFGPLPVDDEDAVTSEE